jgi:3-oxoacyl-[acyl-carrier protein] reductase
VTDEIGVPANTPAQTLEGRVALVTGASGGIGSALARRLAEVGVDLALTYSDHPDDAECVAEKVRSAGRRAVVLRADFADPAAPRRVVTEAEEQLRAGLDILIPAAAEARPKSWREVDLDLWDRTQAVNLRAPFLLVQHVLQGMVGRSFGRILFFSSVAAFNGGIIGPHYASSKAALHGLVHYLAPRVADEGVTVNAIAPAFIAGTRMLPENPHDPAVPLPIPVGRLGTPEEVADFALAMLRNGYLTNKVIGLDGGLHPD